MHLQTANLGVNTDGRRNNRPLNAKNIDDIMSFYDYHMFLKISRNRFLPHFLHPEKNNFESMLPPVAYHHKPANLIPSKHIWSAICRLRSPMFAGKWLEDGIHMVTGSSSGDMSLWNPLTYTQELSFPGHESAVRAISVSHDGNWLISADHNGQVKYWQPNLNFIHVIQAHIDPIRDICFSPTDSKFASCSDDGLIKVWDFEKSIPDCSMQGHGTDVKCLDWHPFKGLILSGSKDCQQPIMLWDPRAASPLCTIHSHKNAIMSIKWNRSGNLFASASKDKTIKIFDIRAMKELQTFRGHKKEVYHVCFHTVNDNFLASGGVDGSLFYWIVGEEKEAATLENAHDGVIWEVSWHPQGHIFASFSNDQAAKIWVRSQPPDRVKKTQTTLPPTSPTTEPSSCLLQVPNSHQDTSKPYGGDSPLLSDFHESENEFSSMAQANPIPGLTTKQKANGYKPIVLPPLKENSQYHITQPKFTCSFPKTTSSRSREKERYLVGKAPKPTLTNEQNIEEEEKYLYCQEKVFGTLFESFEYEDMYEEEQEITPAQFTASRENLNFIDDHTYSLIMDVIRSSKYEDYHFKRNEEQRDRREKSRNDRVYDDGYRERTPQNSRKRR